MKIFSNLRNLFNINKKGNKSRWHYIANPPHWVIRTLQKDITKIGTYYTKGRTFEYKMRMIPLQNHFGYDYFRRKIKE